MPLIALVAAPVAALVVWGLLRTPLGGRVVSAPTGERWSKH